VRKQRAARRENATGVGGSWLLARARGGGGSSLSRAEIRVLAAISSNWRLGPMAASGKNCSALPDSDQRAVWRQQAAFWSQFEPAFPHRARAATHFATCSISAAGSFAAARALQRDLAREDAIGKTPLERDHPRYPGWIVDWQNRDPRSSRTRARNDATRSRPPRAPA
jgi:hypothetical protein